MRTNPYTQINVINGAMHYLAGRGLAGVAGFLTIILLVRFMDVQNYAAYTALSGLVAMCGVLAGLGMDRVVSRYVPEGRLNHSANELGRFIWLTSGMRLIAVLSIVLFLYFLWPMIDRILSVADFGTFSIALACFIVGETMFQHFSSVLQSLVMQKTLTYLLIIQWAGRLILIVTIVAMKSSISWEDALWIFSIPEILGVICFVVAIKCHLYELSNPEQPKTSAERWPNWGNVTEVGMHNYGFTLMAAPPQGYFMKLLTSAYLPAEIVAAYGFFLSIAERARQYIPLHFFYALLEPVLVAAYLKNRDFSTLSHRCQLLYKSSLLLMVPAIAWIGVAGDPVVSVITGGKFQGFSWILLVIMVQLTLGSHVVLLQLMLNSLEKSRLLLNASFYALTAMLIVITISISTNPNCLLLTPLLYSLIINYYIVSQLWRQHYHYKPSWQMMRGVLFSGIMSFLFVSLAANELTWRPITLGMFSLVAVMVIYILGLWWTKAISKFEVQLVASMLPKTKINSLYKTYL